MFNIDIDKELCKGCELCIELCPKKVLGITEKLNSKGNSFSKTIAQDKCIGCMICALVCPDACISITKEDS